ncbi:MAG: Dipeptide transport system permease protein dppC [Synergistales bacterium 54_24]|nr:MAG: Dipeptide transport system permease protein dppC [Synergistales bacterium 54_24]HAF49671.1 ABC transporter permease [Synergistaceae bacterium]
MAGKGRNCVPRALRQKVRAGLWQETISRFGENSMAMVGFYVIAAVAIVAIFAPLISFHDPYEINLRQRLLLPSGAHILGTDAFGRDMLSRIIYGARISLLVGLIPSFISIGIGSAVGVTSGYLGGKIDFILMRVADIVIAFPSLLLAMVIMYTLGAGLSNIFIALSFVGWAEAARVVRSQVLSLREQGFVEAAKAMGVRRRAIMARHIFPNCLPSLVVLFTLKVPEFILAEASLSFLGVGAQPPVPSWGLLVSQGKEFIFSAPWVVAFPGGAIFLVALAFNFVGDGLREALDPYLKR